MKGSTKRGEFNFKNQKKITDSEFGASRSSLRAGFAYLNQAFNSTSNLTLAVKGGFRNDEITQA